jgi:hypothetical protein
MSKSTISKQWLYSGSITLDSSPQYVVEDKFEKPVAYVLDAANAPIVAAAPEMLEALELFVKTFGEGHDPIKNAATVMSKALDAIAKARGEK